MSEVRTTFTSNDKEVQKSLAALQKQMQGLIEQNRKLKEAGQEAANSSSDGFEKMIAGAGRMAAGYLSMSTALSLFNRELDANKKKQDDALASQMTAAQAERTYLLNVGATTDAERNAAQKKALGIARETGTSLADVYRVGAAGVSSTTSKEQMNDVVRMALKVRPDDINEAIAMAGGIGDAANLTGTDDAGVNMGFIQDALGKSRVSTMQGIGSQILRGAASVKSYGGSANEALALVNTITKKINDSTGEKSATLAAAAADQLESLLPKENRYQFDSKGRKTIAAKGTGLDSTDARIAYLQNNPAERERVLASMTLPQGSQSIKELLTPGSAADNIYKSFTRDAVSYDELKKQNNTKLGVINDSPLQQAAGIDRELANAGVRIEEGDFDASSKASIRKAMARTMSAVGVSGLEQFIGNRSADFFSMFQTRENFAAGQAEELRAIERVEQLEGGLEFTDAQRTELHKMIEILDKIANNTGKKLNIDGNGE